MNILNLLEHGARSRLARELGISSQVAGRWFLPGRRVPAERVPDVSRVTGIPKHVLRPDLWEPPHSDHAV